MSRHRCIQFSFALASAALITRLWVGMRLLFAGLDKYRSTNPETGAVEFFKAGKYSEKMKMILGPMGEHTPLPPKAIEMFGKTLGPLLLIIGALTLVGLFRKLSLLAAGFVFLSLGLGLALLPDDREVVFIGVSVLITAISLSLSDHDRFSIDGIFGSLFCKKRKSSESESEASSES